MDCGLVVPLNEGVNRCEQLVRLCTWLHLRKIVDFPLSNPLNKLQDDNACVMLASLSSIDRISSFLVFPEVFFLVLGFHY